MANEVGSPVTIPYFLADTDLDVTILPRLSMFLAAIDGTIL
jgi:hypothetical protein